MTGSDRLQRDRFDAVLFDMDGVVTDTALAHAAAWKRLFDAYLQKILSRGHSIEERLHVWWQLIRHHADTRA